MKQNYLNTNGSVPSLDELKSQIIEREEKMNNLKKSAELVLWKADDLILPLFMVFMLENKSSIRFVKMFDQDPEYYWSRFKTQFPEWQSLFLPRIDDSSDSIVNSYKAFAVHFSERKKDIEQLKKFYTKQMQCVLNFMDKGILASQGYILFDSLVRHFVMRNPHDVKEGHSDKQLIQIGISLLAVLLYNNLQVHVCDKEEEPTICYVLSRYAYYSCAIPPEVFKNTSVNKIMDKYTESIFQNTKNRADRLSLLSSIGPLGMTPGADFALKIHAKISAKEGIHSNITHEDVLKYREQYEFVSRIIQHLILLVDDIILREIDQKNRMDNVTDSAASVDYAKKEDQYAEAILRAELEEKSRELCQIQGKFADCQSLLIHQREESKKLKDRIKELEAENASLKESVSNFEEMLAHIEEEGNSSELTEDDMAIIKGARVVIVGGHNRVHQLLQEACSTIRIIPAEAGQLDANLIRNADVVCFLPHHLSHSVFDNVKKIATMYHIPQVYQPSNNIRFILNTILTGLKNSK